MRLAVIMSILTSRTAGDTLAAPRGYTGSVGEALDVEALSVRYGAMVLRRCRRLLRDEDEALDARQDVFVRLLVSRARLDGTYPSSLLYRIATNVCLNRIRDRARRPETPDEELLAAIASAGSPGGESEARMLLDWLFARQQASSRTIAVLHYVDGLTLEEVARQTHLSVSGVRKRLRKLRHILTETGPWIRRSARREARGARGEARCARRYPI